MSFKIKINNRLLEAFLIYLQKIFDKMSYKIQFVFPNNFYQQKVKKIARIKNVKQKFKRK